MPGAVSTSAAAPRSWDPACCSLEPQTWSLDRPQSCGLCAGCRRQYVDLSDAVFCYLITFVRNLFFFPVGTVYIVNKIDKGKHWICVLSVPFSKRNKSESIAQKSR